MKFETIIKSFSKRLWNETAGKNLRIVRTKEKSSLSLSLFVDAISLAECRKLLSPFHGWNWIESNHRALKYLKADFPFALVFILLHFHCRFSGTTASSPLRNKYQPGPHLTKSSAGKNIKNEHDVFSNRSNFLGSRKIPNFCSFERNRIYVQWNDRNEVERGKNIYNRFPAG